MYAGVCVGGCMRIGGCVFVVVGVGVCVGLCVLCDSKCVCGVVYGSLCE